MSRQEIKHLLEEQKSLPSRIDKINKEKSGVYESYQIIKPVRNKSLKKSMLISNYVFREI